MILRQEVTGNKNKKGKKGILSCTPQYHLPSLLNKGDGETGKKSRNAYKQIYETFSYHCFSADEITG